MLGQRKDEVPTFFKRNEIGRERSARLCDAGEESRWFASHLFFSHDRRASGSRRRVRLEAARTNAARV